MAVSSSPIQLPHLRSLTISRQNSPWAGQYIEPLADCLTLPQLESLDIDRSSNTTFSHLTALVVRSAWLLLNFRGDARAAMMRSSSFCALAIHYRAPSGGPETRDSRPVRLAAAEFARMIESRIDAHLGGGACLEALKDIWYSSALEAQLLPMRDRAFKLTLVEAYSPESPVPTGGTLFESNGASSGLVVRSACRLLKFSGGCSNRDDEILGRWKTGREDNHSRVISKMWFKAAGARARGLEPFPAIYGQNERSDEVAGSKRRAEHSEHDPIIDAGIAAATAPFFPPLPLAPICMHPDDPLADIPFYILRCSWCVSPKSRPAAFLVSVIPSQSSGTHIFPACSPEKARAVLFHGTVCVLPQR
ncbi:hypothetical protein FB451DRAFT_1168127 [Mycena latifolia]|nr:hypothetical protein FB451DRAFT_1168127 [Mycena latifolia]